MKLEYPYTLEPQESGGFVVQFLDVEEAFTEGATPEECAFNAAEVLTGILEQRLEDERSQRPPSSDGQPLSSSQIPSRIKPTMRERERLHALIDTLPEDELQAALRFLEHLGTEDLMPLWSLSDAPADDEPLTENDEAALAEAEQDLTEGRIVTHAEARRRLLGDA